MSEDLDPDADEAALVSRMAELERTKSAAAAEQARLAAALEARRVAAAKAGGPRVSRAALGSEVGLARRESPHRGERLMAMARILTADMPCTLAALESGVLSEHRAELITTEAACLSALDRGLLDIELCGDPTPLEGMGNAELSAEAARRVYELDQQTVLDKMARARDSRHVRFRVARDGMMSMTVLLPAVQGQLVRQALSREAATAVSAGSERSRQQVMADVVVERVTGRNPVETPVPVAVNLVLSDATLLTGGEEPAQLDGYGPVPAALARDLVLAAAADEKAGAALRRLYAQPGTNKLVAMESTARAFPKALATFIGLRDQICRTPYCNAPIRHTDHITPHRNTGPTSAHNGDGLCEHCNYVKEEPGWQAAASYDRYGRHTIALSTPSGAVYTSTAPPTPEGLRIFTRDVYLARINPAA